MGFNGNYFNLERLNMLVNKIMQVLSNLFGLNKKINASDVAVKKNNKGVTLNDYLDNINEYSTEETVIGKWIDGKPLYQKVITFDNTISISYDDNTFIHNISNIDIIFVKNAFVYSKNEKRFYSIPVTLYNSNTATDDLNIMVDREKINFYVKSGWNTAWQKVIILNYTKTTD